MPAAQAGKWLQRADVCAALGLAWGEIRHWEEAIDWLGKALTAEKGECSMRALEQYANFCVRHSAECWQKARHLAKAKREEVRNNAVASIESAILDLDTLCQRAPTVERLNLLGSAYKRLAQVEAEPRQLEALVNMAHHYRLSFDRRRENRRRGFPVRPPVRGGCRNPARPVARYCRRGGSGNPDRRSTGRRPRY